jgi:hypothetical protein
MESWLRIAVFAVILLSFLRRIVKMKNQGRPSSSAPPTRAPRSATPTITPTIARPRYGRKNDFRDVPPPPENPDLG